MTTPPKANILIVDDTPANLRLLTGILVEQGYKVRAAPNGALALKAAQSDPPDNVQPVHPWRPAHRQRDAPDRGWRVWWRMHTVGD